MEVIRKVIKHNTSSNSQNPKSLTTQNIRAGSPCAKQKRCHDVSVRTGQPVETQDVFF